MNRSKYFGYDSLGSFAQQGLVNYNPEHYRRTLSGTSLEIIQFLPWEDKCRGLQDLSLDYSN